MKKNIIQWAIALLLINTGIASFIVLCGEIQSESFAMVVVYKVIALAVMAGCVWMGKVADKYGMLPDLEME